MARIVSLSRAASVVVLATAALLTACADAPVAPARTSVPEISPPISALEFRRGDGARAIATIMRSTARYHDLDVAKKDGFVFLHECENRPDEGPVGNVYVHMARLLDGVINPAQPEALIYAPRRHGKPRLVGVELGIPFPLWSATQPPSFLGHAFQPEDEFGVWGLHLWVWSYNPDGLFAESNPRVTCGGE